MKMLLSLFDQSGNWSRPYARAGWRVVRVDLEEPVEEPGVSALRLDVAAFRRTFWHRERFSGILIADPCTEWSGSGARHWARKDADGTTKRAELLVREWLAIVQEHPEVDFWARENPVGRSNRIVPDLAAFGPQPIPQPSGQSRGTWHPWFYGDPYTKATQLWGRFNAPQPGPVVKPVMHTTANGKRGSWMWAKLGGKSARTKQLRSATPQGFARAFYEANH